MNGSPAVPAGFALSGWRVISAPTELVLQTGGICLFLRRRDGGTGRDPLRAPTWSRS